MSNNNSLNNVARCFRWFVGEQQLLAPPEKFPKHRLPMLCGEIAGISFIPGCVSNSRLFIRPLTPGFWRLSGKVLLA
jgi:hypothetical protein